MNKTNKAIGKKFKALRQRRKLSLREVYRKTGVDHSVLSLIERGESRLAYINAVLLCVFYDISLAALAREIQTDSRGNIV